MSEHVSRQHEIKIDGVDISKGIVSVSIGYTSVQLEDCPEISARIVVDRSCGLSLLPTNPLWQEYASVSARFAKLTGVLAPSPFGGKQRLQRTRILEWGFDGEPNLIELTCVCDVGYSRDPSSFATVAGVRMPVGATQTDLLNSFWATKSMAITPVAGDVVLLLPNGLEIIYPAQKLNTSTHCHKIASCNPPTEGQLVYHWVDNLGRLRLVKASLLSADVWRSYPTDGLDEPLEPLQNVTEQLPGRIKARSLVTIFTQLPTTDTSFIESSDIRQITTTSIDGDSTDEIYEQDRVVYPDPPSNNPDETPAEKALRTSLKFSRFTQYSKNWDVNDRFSGSFTRTDRPRKSINPEATTNGVIAAEMETISVSYSGQGVMSERVTETRKVAGLTSDEDTPKDTLVDYETKVERWQPAGNGRYFYTSTTTNFVDKRLGKDGVTKSRNSNAQVPATEIKPSVWDVKPQELFADSVVAYHPDETLNGSVDVVGYGTYTGTLDYFSGTYKVTPTVGNIYQGEGQLYNVSGVIEGVGQFRGGGSWTGTRRPLRDEVFDCESYPRNWLNLKRTAQLKAILTYGRKFAFSGALKIDDAMFDDGGIRPGLQVRIGDNIYLLNNPTIEWDNKRFQLFADFELIGKMVSNAFVSALTFMPEALGSDFTLLVDNNGYALAGT